MLVTTCTISSIRRMLARTDSKDWRERWLAVSVLRETSVTELTV